MLALLAMVLTRYSLLARSGAGSGASATLFVARELLYVARWRDYVEPWREAAWAGERRVATSRGDAYPAFGRVRSSVCVACRGVLAYSLCRTTVLVQWIRC
jgi:hypothetical protein